MSRDASIEFDWADGHYRFRLAIGQLRELQEKCDAGPPVIFRRLIEEKWRVEDLTETIRLGLIGGGTKPDEARKLVRRYVEERPLQESILPAQAILSALLVGAPDEALKKAEGTEQTTPGFPTESSASPRFTAQAA